MSTDHVHSLKNIATMTLTHNILDQCLKSGPVDCTSSAAIQELEVEEVVEYMLQSYQERLPNGLILSLCPAYLQQLSLRGSHHLSTQEVYSILSKCHRLRVLSLTCCDISTGLDTDKLISSSYHNLGCLVKLSLKQCCKLRDENVQVLLRTCSSLRQLIIHDSAITDEAFLVDKPYQDSLENAEQIGSVRFLCQLETVDVTGCVKLSNIGLLHLCSLSGPSLRSLNVQQTSVSWSGLVYLCGYNYKTVGFFHNEFHTLARQRWVEGYGLKLCLHGHDIPCVYNDDMKDGMDQKEQMTCICIPAPMFHTGLKSLAMNADLKECDQRNCAQACLKVFLDSNPHLKEFSLHSSRDCGPYEHHDVQFPKLLHVMKDSGVDLEHLALTSDDLFSVVKNRIVSELLGTFTNLCSLDLSGCSNLSDRALHRLQQNNCLKAVYLSTLDSITTIPFSSESLLVLDLSWCAELSEQELNRCLSLCPSLTQLDMRCCQVTNETLHVLSQNCKGIQKLDISKAQDVDDDGIVHLAQALPALTEISVNSNCYLGNSSVQALLTCCPRLKRADFSCLPAITDWPFRPIMSGWKSWLSWHSRNRKNVLPEKALPLRSTSFAPCLEYVNLYYCGNICDDNMRTLVQVCRGFLVVLGYHNERVSFET